MTLEFSDGWEDDHQIRGVDAQELDEKIKAAISDMETTDKEFKFLRDALNATSLFVVKVTKGLHQEEGNWIIPEKHVTLEVADWPRPKRFHLYFMSITKKVKKKKVLGWYPCRLTHFDHALDREIKSISV